MSRAKQKGTSFERQVVEYLARETGQELDRMPLHGTKDRGDVAGLRIGGKRAVVECKNRSKAELSQWLDEAEREAENDGAEFGFAVFKRRGYGDARMGGTYVLCSLKTLARLARM